LKNNFVFFVKVIRFTYNLCDVTKEFRSAAYATSISEVVPFSLQLFQATIF